MEFMEGPSVTDQLVGIGQDLIGLPRLVLVDIIGVTMHLRHDGVNMVVRNLVEDVHKPRRDASMALFHPN